MLTHLDIDRVRDILVSQFSPKAIYLFGSYAQGRASDESDLDLLVVDRDEVYSKNRSLEMNLSLFPRKYSLDLLCFSEQQFKRKVQEKRLFFNNLIKTGRKIYEQP